MGASQRHGRCLGSSYDPTCLHCYIDYNIDFYYIKELVTKFKNTTYCIGHVTSIDSNPRTLSRTKVLGNVVEWT